LGFPSRQGSLAGLRNIGSCRPFPVYRIARLYEPCSSLAGVSEDPRPQLTTVEFFTRAVIVVLVALIPVLVWFLFDVILIVIGAIIVAVLLRLVAEPCTRWLRLPESVGLVCSGLVTVAVVAGAGYLFGTQIDAELTEVVQRANSGVTNIMHQLQSSPTGKIVLQHIQGGGGFSFPSFLSGLFSVSISFLEAVVITVIGGFYLAVQPALYRSGLGKLFPRRIRDEVNETIDDIGVGLRLWLIGQLIQMVLIGALTTMAVWFVGLPSPLALGVIAALAEFVPYIGPLIAAVPAILVASTQGLNTVIWTAIAYLAIHQIEGNLVVPLIQRQLIFIPPAVVLFGIVTILFVFGGVSVIFAEPIAVIVFVATKKLYVREALGERTVLPGENKS
jgi:predicted PurR-regulated permease PerM